MQCIAALVPVVLHVVAVSGAVSYCGARMCGHSDGHTYCQYRVSLVQCVAHRARQHAPGPSPSCAGYMDAQLSPDEKARILVRLNRRRSEVALGWRHWPPAGDMLKLRWIEELSREAQRWADQCRSPQGPEERDVCRDLYSISVGQCVASIVGEAPGLRPESMVDMWFMQSMLYDGNVTSYIPASIKNFYGDFAQIMWSRTYLVGCGRSRFMAEWRGRLRSVERLVCNFAPRGPVPSRPLWAPAEAASMCPPRSYPDISPGLCSYQNFVNDSTNLNESLPAQDNYLLETVFEIEKNESLNYLGSLDELYLTKIAVATIGPPMPMIPLYYSLQKRDVLEQNGKDDELLMVGNLSEYSMETQQLMPTEITIVNTKSYKTKLKTVGRPKPYDINELDDAVAEEKHKNVNDIQDLPSNKEKDLYTEYGIVDAEEEDIVNTSEAVGVESIRNENTTHIEETSIETRTENNSNTDGMVASVNYLDISNEDINGSLLGNKTVEDYLSDPETVRALQEALDQMERTLATRGPVSTSGKVRRELRNLEANLQSPASTEAREVDNQAGEIKVDETTKKEVLNTLKDKGPMLSMVLKYMPYLKPYESSIIGNTHSHCDAVRYDVSVVMCILVLPVVVL